MTTTDDFSGPIPGWLVGSCLVVAIFALGLAVAIVWRLSRRKPVRFSLRTLLLAMSACAVAAILIPKLGEWMFPDSFFYIDLGPQPATPPMP